MAEAFLKSEAIAYFDDTKKFSGICEFYDSQIIIRDNDQTEKKTFDVADYEDISVVMETKKGFFSKKYCINISSNSLNRNFLILCYKSIENAELCKTTIEKKIKETATINANNKKYAEACNLLKKDSKESIENAIKTFDTISFWKNSKDLIKQGKDRLNEINNDELYFEALSLIKKAEKSLLKADYEEAISQLNKIKNWKDSNEQLSKCQTKLNEIIEKENKEKQKNYDAAILLAKEDTVESLEKAIKQLPEDWKDSKTLLQTFQKRIADIKEAQENERKQKSYDAAIIEAKKDTISSYEKAIRVLSSISGWKDSEQLIKAFNKRIDEIRIEEENARKEQTYVDALKIASGKTVKDQEKAIKLFSDIIEWKDSKEQIEKCKNAKKHIEEAAFYNKIDEVINSSKQEVDNHDKYSSNVKKFKSALTKR